MRNFPLEIKSSFVIEWIIPWAALMAVCAIVTIRNKKKKKGEVSKDYDVFESKRGLAKYDCLGRAKNGPTLCEIFCFISISLMASRLIFICIIEGYSKIVYNAWVPRLLSITGLSP